MGRIIKFVFVAVLISAIAGLIYGGKGYADAISDAERLRDRANHLISAQRGGDALGAGRLNKILMVQDPAFKDHSGVDLKTAGAGITTISQSVSKRLAFDTFRPGVGKIRQTGYAIGLERVLEKDQIFAHWLDTLEMGRGPDGWMTGFYQASEAIFERQPDALSDEEFFRLTAVIIAPNTFDLRGNDPALIDRINRITRLITGECVPMNNGDVWLDGCS